MLNILKVLILFSVVNVSLQTADLAELISKSLQEIVKPITTCIFKLSDGKIIDLTSVFNKKESMIAYLGKYSYVFDPCKIYMLFIINLKIEINSIR